MASTTKSADQTSQRPGITRGEEFNTTMASTQRKIRGTILGLALTAMLAFGGLGAGAAQATPAWHIDGEELVGEESVFSQGGPFEFRTPGWNVTFTCEVGESTGTISGNGKGQASLEFAECEVENAPACEIHEPISMEANTELVQVGDSVYEKFVPAVGDSFLVLHIESCALEGEWPVKGSFAAKVGPKALEPTLTFSHEAQKATGTKFNIFGTNYGILDGSSSLMLTGENVGSELSAE